MTHRPNAGFPAITALAADLADERLAGAACTGLAPLFDADPAAGESETDRDARHASAGRICRRCPVNAAFTTAAAELGKRAAGVWAGRVHGAGHRGRPKASTS